MERNSEKYVVIGARISLGILLLLISTNFITIYKISGGAPIWDITTWAATYQYLFSMLLLVLTSIFAGIFYFYKKYRFVIAATVLFFIVALILN